MVTQQNQPLNTTSKPFILKDKNGNVINNIRLASGVVATLIGYDEQKKTFILSVPDNEANQKKYPGTSNPEKKRKESGENSKTMKLIKQEWDKGKLPISISFPSKQAPTVRRLEDGSFQIDMTTREFSAQRSLMHIDNRTEEEKIADKTKTDQAQAVSEKATQKKESFLSKHWGKILIGILLIVMISILGFHKGGWWNKKKKSPPQKNESKTETPNKTEANKSTVGQMTTLPAQNIGQMTTPPAQNEATVQTPPNQNTTINDGVIIQTQNQGNITTNISGTQQPSEQDIPQNTQKPTIDASQTPSVPSSDTELQPSAGTSVPPQPSAGTGASKPVTSDVLGSYSTLVTDPNANTSVAPTINNHNEGR